LVFSITLPTLMMHGQTQIKFTIFFINILSSDCLQWHVILQNHH